jgi:hypothetical protein
VERVKARLNATPLPAAPLHLARWLGAAGLLMGAGSLVAVWWARTAPDALPELIHWESGRLALNAASPVLLQTREGQAVGKGDVAVERDALGTRFLVQQGRLAVNCVADDDAVIDAGEALCRPVSADTMLGRIRALQTLGGSPEALLNEVDLAQSRDEGSPPARDELGALRVTLLEATGRPDEALAQARAWLDAGSTVRRNDVLRVAASLALTAEGCAGALPHLNELAASDRQAAAVLSVCKERGTP